MKTISRYLYLIDQDTDVPMVVFPTPHELRGTEVSSWERRLRAQEGVDEAKPTSDV